MSDSDNKFANKENKDSMAVALSYEPESDYAPKVVVGRRSCCPNRRNRASKRRRIQTTRWFLATRSLPLISRFLIPGSRDGVSSPLEQGLFLADHVGTALGANDRRMDGPGGNIETAANFVGLDALGGGNGDFTREDDMGGLASVRVVGITGIWRVRPNENAPIAFPLELLFYRFRFHPPKSLSWIKGAGPEVANDNSHADSRRWPVAARLDPIA